MDLIRLFFSIFMMTLQSIGASSDPDAIEPDEPAEVQEVLFPSPLTPGDRIALLAPSGAVDRRFVDQAAKTIRQMGYEPVIYSTSYSHHGRFSGTPLQRFSDLKAALLDPEIRAVVCARGGYGMVHILDSIATLPLREDPKWVVGYSDISALHALLASKGIASVHASMARHLALGSERTENRQLFEILTDSFPTYTFRPNRRNHPGRAEGKLIGGNLSVLQALIDTPYDIFEPGCILFIEDVSEPVYKVERMLYQLKMAGILDKISGLIIGQFTEYRVDDSHYSMEQMIADVLKDYPDLPVVFDAPVGHVTYNVPMIVSANAVLDVSPSSVTLRLSK